MTYAAMKISNKRPQMLKVTKQLCSTSNGLNYCLRLVLTVY